MSHSDLIDEFIAGVPAPGQTPQDRLAHTLSCFAHLSDAAPLQPLDGPMLLLRHLDNDDARTIVNVLATGRPDDEFAVRATCGVYGQDLVTGLTWADLRALAN